MKRSKINFFTSMDGKTWVDKEQLLTLMEELYNKHPKKKKFYGILLDELEKAKKVEAKE